MNDRLDELSKVSSKWTPEVLSLFLHLADRPATNSRIESLELLNAPEPVSQVTWQKIVQDDPLNETGVWDDIDYAAESDEASILDATLEPSLLVEETKIYPEDLTLIHAEDNNQSANLKGLELLKDSQFWKHRDWDHSAVSENTDQFRGLSLITELQTIREVLFMLQGLPTSLFNIEEQTKIVSLNECYRLSHVEIDTFRSVLERLAQLGSAINRIRCWTFQNQPIPLLQAFQTAVRIRLRNFDSTLANIESRYGDRKHNVSVSLIEVHNDLMPSSRRLLLLGDLLDQLNAEERKPPFQCLELLFHAACTNQTIGDDGSFQFFGTLFFECFDTYLKPIRLWMEQGIIQKEDPIFFIQQKLENNPTGSIFSWQNQYTIRKTSSGDLIAPSFLHTIATKILNTGKSIIFLDRLGLKLHRRELQDTQIFDFDSVCKGETWNSLASFQEMFNIAFDAWIIQEHQSVSNILSHQLYTSCGLWRSLDALDRVFCFKDGAVASKFALPIFQKMDRGKESWNDRFLLTELTHSVFSNIDCIDVGRLSIRSLPGAYGDIQSKRRSVKVLSRMVLEYAVRCPLLPSNLSILTCSAALAPAKYYTTILAPHLPEHLYFPATDLTSKIYPRTLPPCEGPSSRL